MSELDDVDAIAAAWKRERPDLDVGSIGIITRVSRLATTLSRHREAVLADHGTDSSTLDLLSTLRRAGVPYELTPTELAERSLITSGGISQRLAKAEAQGLIARSPSPTDGRSTVVGLTAAGRDLVDRTVAEVLTSEAGLVDTLDKNQQDTLAGLLRDLLAGISGTRT